MNNKKYIKGINAYRAIAIVGVTLFHIYPNIFKGGYLGVCMFFVLTGFLLAVSNEEFHFFAYIKKRIQRIYPGLLITILVTCGICFFINPSVLNGKKMEVLSILGGYNNWWQIQSNADYFTKSFNHSPFTHFWFLGIEIQYYLLWPIIYLIYKAIKKNKTVGSSLLIGFGMLSAGLLTYYYEIGVDITELYYATDTRIFSLLFGSALGLLYVSEKKIITPFQKYTTYLIFSISILFSIAMFFLLDGQSSLLYCGGMLLMTFIFLMQLYFISNPSYQIGDFFEKMPIQWIGKHSFSIYLVQYPVLFLFTLCKLTNIPYYQILELGITCLSAFVLDTLLHPKNRKNFFVILLSVLVAICMGFGGYGLIQSKENEAIHELEQKLEKDTKEIEEAKQKMLEEAEKQKEVEPQEGDFCSKDGVLAIGDSILLGSWNYVYEELPGSIVDGEVNRYISAALPLLQRYGAQGYIHNTVVIALGSNGPLYPEHVESVLDYLGEDIDIFFVNNYAPYVEWMDFNNEYIQQICDAHLNVHQIDWVSLASVHPEYLSGDETHPNPEGAPVYARLIRETIESTPNVHFLKEHSQ